MGNSSLNNKNADVTYPSGNRYVGSMKGQQRHGHGTMYWQDGARYDGEWVNNEMHGNGEIHFPNGSFYVGEFSHSSPYGRGVLTTINKEKIDGNWQYQGRSVTQLGPVGKYFFTGMVYDPNSDRHVPYNGSMTLHLTSGLVALPNMQDPLSSVLPYASVVNTTAEEGRKILHEAMKESESNTIPQGKVVETTTTTTSSSNGIAYGYRDPALLPPHPDDHGRVDVLDPRLWLNGLGITAFGAPTNFNEQRQREIAQERNLGQTIAPPPNTQVFMGQ
jgi:hypothetical protein